MGDPNEPARTIIRTILQAVTLCIFAASVGAVVLLLSRRLPIPWMTTSYAAITQEEADLISLGDSRLADTLVYVIASAFVFIAMTNILGCIAATLHRKTELKSYSVTMFLLLLASAGVVIITVIMKDKLLAKVAEFSQMSLTMGFTGKSHGINDTAPGAIITYIWQWMQVKFECCGWVDGKDYQECKIWETGVAIFDLTNMSLVRANKLLTLPNRLVYIPDENLHDHSTTADPEATINPNSLVNEEDIITKVALKQVIPPTCCEIGAESLERVSIPVPQHFMNLTLKNPDCIYTYENSHWATGCYDSLNKVVTTNMYTLAGIGSGLVVGLLVVIGLASHLGGLQSKEEWEREQEDNTMERKRAEIDKHEDVTSAASSASAGSAVRRKKTKPKRSGIKKNNR